MQGLVRLAVTMRFYEKDFGAKFSGLREKAQRVL